MAERKSASKVASASKSKPSPAKQPDKSEADFYDSMYQKNLFLVMVMDMTWQLALVVLIPIIGGFYLDKFFHTAPGLLIVGFLVAALGVVMVMLHIVKEANRRSGFGGKK